MKLTNTLHNIQQIDFKYSIIMLAVLLINAFLCAYTLMFFSHSSTAIISNIIYLLTSIVLIVNINANKYLSYIFHLMVFSQLFISMQYYDTIELQSHKVVLLVSLLVLNFCKFEYDRQNQLMNAYQEVIENLDSDDESDDEYDEKKFLQV